MNSIDTRDLRIVRTKLIDAVSTWKKLGQVLDIQQPQLEVFMKDNPYDTDGCMDDMLAFWLRGNARKPITWQTLIDALNDPLVGLGTLADKVKREVVEEAQNDIN